jgi:hypothetical protein
MTVFLPSHRFYVLINYRKSEKCPIQHFYNVFPVLFQHYRDLQNEWELSTVFNGSLCHITTGAPSEKFSFTLQVAVQQHANHDVAINDGTTIICRALADI